MNSIDLMYRSNWGNTQKRHCTAIDAYCSIALTEQYLPHKPGKEITDEQQKSFMSRAAIGVCPWLIDRIFLAEPFSRKPMT